MRVKIVRARSLRRVLTQQSGISLVWVLTVILVLLIASGAALLAVNARFNIAVVEHEEQQAHYTALSALDTVSRWIAAGFEPEASPKQQEAVEQLLEEAKGSGGANYPLEGLDSSLGECSLHLEYPNPLDTRDLKLTATATFAGVTETFSLTMRQEEGAIADKSLLVPNYDLTAYDAHASKNNALPTTGIVALYDSVSGASNVPANRQDEALLNSYITSSNAYEARWTDVSLNSPTTSYTDSVLGTQLYPINGSGDHVNDSRRFKVPQNGRITIDPLEGDTKFASANTESAGDNTRLVSLAIDNTAAKSVRFRLASNSAATKGKLLNLSGTFYNRSNDRWASLLMFNFTDNAENSATETYSINGTKKTYPWHPNNWKDMDVYVPTDGEVTSNLVLGPFGHKYNTTLDYFGRGNFVDLWHGTKVGELKAQWPYLSTDSGHFNDPGLPIFPLDYGRNAGFWILDGRSNRYFRIMQGVNILDGTIYSTRPTIIGGGLIRSKRDYTTDNLNRALYGFAYNDPTQTVSYVEATTRFSQLIYNTDIILKAPLSGTANSLIRRPDTWRDRTNTVTDYEKTFEPTMTIKGGTIYVGERQSLTIQGSALDNMWINPESVFVAQGGSLTIQASTYLNVLTNIYVDGGALTIEKGAKIKGNIYAYNGGTVRILGDFTLLSPHDNGNNNVLTEDEAKDGIYIYGSQLVGKVDGVTQPGTLILPETAPEFVTIIGSSNKVHILGAIDATTLNNPNRQPFSEQTIEKIKKAKVLCNDRDPITGACRHFGFLGGGWTTEGYARD
jgi:type II secretory pathway pseudopilin PulG